MERLDKAAAKDMSLFDRAVTESPIHAPSDSSRNTVLTEANKGATTTICFSSHGVSSGPYGA